MGFAEEVGPRHYHGYVLNLPLIIMPSLLGISDSG
jgi:hypothetical protein